ncbi:hypothetical protein [Ruegeria arenilitoris]|uniref:hypothetical protein n=1 Tax=Ruegeria arenilitoris TaxID=1173585 RepID=UPI00147C5DFC|nr:hypothetical protein [Ruegeria arenilitoris]
MTNERASANRDDVTNPNKGLTRDELQHEAVTVECLLDAAVALIGARNSREELVEVTAYAQDRAKNLNSTMDSVNKPELAS